MPSMKKKPTTRKKKNVGGPMPKKVPTLKGVSSLGKPSMPSAGRGSLVSKAKRPGSKAPTASQMSYAQQQTQKSALRAQKAKMKKSPASAARPTAKPSPRPTARPASKAPTAAQKSYAQQQTAKSTARAQGAKLKSKIKGLPKLGKMKPGTGTAPDKYPNKTMPVRKPRPKSGTGVAGRPRKSTSSPDSAMKTAAYQRALKAYQSSKGKDLKAKSFLEAQQKKMRSDRMITQIPRQQRILAGQRRPTIRR